MKNFTLVFLYCLAILLPSVVTAQVPALNSYPSAAATIYLDFDGATVNAAYWNSGNTLQCEAAPLSNTQITEVFNRVAEDYRPFSVNITTELAKFEAAPTQQRIRIIVTPTSAWRPGVGGVSYTGSFTWGDDTPGFVFTDRLGSVKAIAECISHESGHTVGLSHQSRYNGNCQLTETYNTGEGTGETSWAPIMGNSYGRNMTGWNNGPTPYGCNNTQDNLTIITTQNGFGYRTDDHGNNNDAGASILNNVVFNAEGVISTTADKDAFQLNMPATGPVHLEVKPFMVGSGYNTGANLDVLVELFNGSQLLRTYSPAESMSVLIDTSLVAGQYYIVVSGDGNLFTNGYGSLGSYILSGNRGALPIRSISLQGNASGNKHSLQWNIIADEPIQMQELQSSTDANNFAAIGTINNAQRSFNNTVSESAVMYYRLKVTTVAGEQAYSNTIALKSAGQKAFTVTTLIKNEIKVNAPEKYQYRIVDINGRTIAAGNGQQGANSIYFTRPTPGMYFIQLLGVSAKQSERILKQ